MPLVAPTWERGQHDPVRQVEKSVADVDGGIAWPYTVEFVLQRLHSKGLITDEAMDAGEDFRNDFRIGELDPLRAAAMDRPVVSGMQKLPLSWRAEAARNRVNRALLLVGGRSSIYGLALWHILGCEESIEQWRTRVNLTWYRAQRVLIRALQQLGAARACREHSAELRSREILGTVSKEC